MTARGPAKFDLNREATAFLAGPGQVAASATLLWTVDLLVHAAVKEGIR